MKANILKMMRYFSAKYNLNGKNDQYKYVADELGVSPGYVKRIMSGTTPDKAIEKLINDVVETLGV